MGAPQCGHAIFGEAGGMVSFFLASTEGDLPPSMAQSLRHPYKLFQELAYSWDKGRLAKDALRSKHVLHIGEIYVPENGNKTEFAHDGKHILDHACSTEWTRGNADDSDCLMNVFFKATVEHVLQQSGITVVVFRRHYNEAVCSLHFFR